MSTKVTISKDRNSAFNIEDSDTVVVLAKGAAISSVFADDAPYGIYEGTNGLRHNAVTVNGGIYSSDSDGAKLKPIGVMLNSTNSSITVGASGSILSYTCLQIVGDHGTISNAGTLTGLSNTGTGIFGSGSDLSVSNSGSITGYVGVVASGDHIHMTNAKTGVITGYFVAVGAPDSDHVTLINHGLIQARGAGSFAFQEGSVNAFTSRIVNDGTIVGNLDLQNGNSTVDTRGGIIRGLILGGLGDDTLITDRANYKLNELAGGGTDTVKSTVGYTLSDNVENLILLGNKDTKGIGNDSGNTLEGNAGDNVLTGGGGVDILHGGRGNDTLSGGIERDTFVFRTGDGHDTIADFETIDEHIDVSGWKAVHGFSQLQDHMTNQQGGVMITFGHDSLFVDNLHKADLQDRHFII